MIPKEMIEAAAKAAYEAEYDSGYGPWDSLDETERYSYRVIAEVALAAALSVQWQGIESAPRDGNWILGHLRQRSLVTAYPMFWNGEIWSDGDPDFAMIPTHWMPMLPPPPTEKK